jgi:hypothetical protein
MSATERLKRRLAELQHECARLAAVELALAAVIRAQQAELTRLVALGHEPAGIAAVLLRRLDRAGEPHMEGQLHEGQAGAAVEPSLVQEQVVLGGTAGADQGQGGSSCVPGRLRREGRAGGER